MQSYCPCKESHVGWGLNLPNTFLEEQARLFRLQRFTIALHFKDDC
jgi:hypothetical protein